MKQFRLTYIKIDILAIEKEIHLKYKIKYIVTTILVLVSVRTFAQHHINMVVEVNAETKTLTVNQELTYFNQSNDTLSSLVLNDWNNAYSDKNSPLGKRFSDEFVRSFHLANKKERGSTYNVFITDNKKTNLYWCRSDNSPDIIEIQLKNKIMPYEKETFLINYTLKIPDDKFTKYGYDNNGNFNLKSWFLSPSIYSNQQFVKYNNLNIDDIPNALFNVDLTITIPNDYSLNSDLTQKNKEGNTYYLSDNSIFDIPLYLEKKITFESFKNSSIEVLTNIQEKKITDIQKAIIIDKVVNYISVNLGKTNLGKISVSQTDYEKNPFYGLNQLPAFFSPFPNDFIYEMKFLKTYLNNYLKNTLQLDSRKDNWVYDCIQVYYMMKYIDDNYPEAKMTGNLSKYKIIRGYNLISLDFNKQYNYFYMLMARKNLDQPLSNSKNTLIKFNEKIASKYRAGLSLKYLEEYIGKNNLNKSISDFITFATINKTDASLFINTLKSNTDKDINWFSDVIINSRDLIDYKFQNVTKTIDSVSFQLKNKTNVVVPIPVYGLKNKEIVFKEWINPIKKDSIYSFQRKSADKIVINYNNEVPEYNLRNNFKSLKPFHITNKPIKFIFLKDLEEPNYNQIIYVPTLQYNFYDGFIAGMRFFNKSILNKPLVFDITPSYSTKSEDISGTFSFYINQDIRVGKLYNIRYGLGGDYFHYAQDAYYQKINPFITFRFRENDYRDNKGKFLMARQVYVNREKSNFVKNTFEGSYSIFNLRYANSTNEITRGFGYSTDLQLSGNFGKLAGEIGYRRMYDDNRQISLRFFAGLFLYNSTSSNYFNFALDRPSDYLFDYNYLARSESTGLYSQQFLLAEGGFKSKIPNSTANDWLAAINGTATIWNWIEVYSDIGLIKSKNQNHQFMYDSGIRLNLVPDYLEFYLPIYSNNGWEISQPHYNEKFRFIAAFSTNTILKLFSRKWF